MESTNQDSVIDWYNELAQLAESYSIAITPFEHIELQYGPYATCLPGMGTDRFDYEMGRALALLLLSKLLPMKGNDNNTELSQALALATNKRQPNGYYLLHVTLNKVINAFDDDAV